MKSKRRHELKQNVLDAELGKGVQFLKKRGTQLLWGGVIIALVVLVALYAYRNYTSGRAALKARYSALKAEASDPSVNDEDLLERFRALAEQDDDKRIAALACVDLGDIHAGRMLAAAAASPTGPGRAESARKAAEYYHLAIRRFPDETLAVAKAHIGLAKLAESRQDFNAAEAEYQAVLKMASLRGWPVMKCAERNLEELDSLRRKVRMATTLPTQPTTLPAGPKLSTQPSSAVAPAD